MTTAKNKAKLNQCCRDEVKVLTKELTRVSAGINGGKYCTKRAGGRGCVYYQLMVDVVDAVD